MTRLTNIPGNSKLPLRNWVGCLLFALLLMYNSTALAQERTVVNQSIQWTSFNANIKLNQKYGLTVDGQFRFAEGGSMQHQLRAGFEIYLKKNLSFVPLHYSYLWNYQYGKLPAAFANNEQRLGQQLIFRHNYARFSFNHRLRTEERFIQVHSKDEEGQVINEGFTNRQFRVRYRALVNYALTKPTITAGTLYLTIYDEIFMSRGKQITYHKPDQNRFFVGPGFQINKPLSIQCGYLYQTLIRSNGTRQENNSGVLLTVNYNLDLSKTN